MNQPCDLPPPRSSGRTRTDAAVAYDGPPQQKETGWLLDQLREDVPGTRKVLLLSADGMPLASSPPDRDLDDQLSAVACGAISLGKTASRLLEHGGVTRQALLDLGDVTMFMGRAGQGTVMAVIASREADAAVLGWKMDELAKAVGPHLAVRPREPSDCPSSPASMQGSPPLRERARA